MCVNLLPYCPRDLQLGGIDGGEALPAINFHQLGLPSQSWVKTEGRDENLRILVSGRDPRSRDESNGQRPPAPAGWFGAISGWVGGGEAAGRGGSQK